MANANAPFTPAIVNIALGSLAPTSDAFGRCLIIGPKATNSLAGERTKSFLTYQDAVLWGPSPGAGYISAAMLKAVGVAFSQTNVPAQGVLVGNVDLVATESYSEALVAITLIDPVFYLVTILSRVSADIEDVSQTVEWMNVKADAETNSVPFKYCFFCAQTADADVLTGTMPAGLADYVGREYTNISYSPTSTEWLDVAHQSQLSVDLATASPGWVLWSAKAVASYPAGSITTAQRDFAKANNVDLMLVTGNTTNGLTSVGFGTNGAGRQISEVVTAAWLATNFQVGIDNLFVQQAVANIPITLTASGQQAVVGVLQGVTDTAIQAGSVRATDDNGAPGFTITAETISGADRTAKQMRFSVAVTVPVSANQIVVNLATSTTSVV